MQPFLNAVRLAIAEIARSWSRSLLTSLGVLIGVAAVIAMVGLGSGATASVEQDLQSMGNNLLMVHAGTGRGPQRSTAAPPLKASDAEAIALRVPYVAAVAPTTSASATASWQGVSWDTSVTGSTASWVDVGGWTVAQGRVFTDGEERAGAAACVLGDLVREELFGGADPLGARIRLGASTCEVVGVLEAKGANAMGMEQDDLVLAPLPLVQRRLAGSDDVDMIMVTVDTEDHIDAAAAGVDALLRDLRHISSDDGVNFTVFDTREMAAMVTGITTTLTAFLAAVAGVSLLVGGIGIMNIMLVSVTERTREIGIRMSIGALEGDVMTQFLVEAVVLSGFGGLVGVILGIGGTAIGSALLDVPFVVNPAAVAAALVFSAVLGVGFGWVPARRAARMEPIDALRR